MSEAADYGRLSGNWTYWSAKAGLDNVSVSSSCDDCAILFSSNDYSVHLRHDGDWWVVDTVDDRRQRRNDTAKFTVYDLVEKYLVWIWASTARSVIGAPNLGRELYASGFAPGVEATQIRPGFFELDSPGGRAVLMEPYGTIFSHLIDKPVEQIEEMVRTGV